MSTCKRCRHFQFYRVRLCLLDRQRVLPEDGVSRCAEYEPNEFTLDRIMAKLPENPNDIAHLIYVTYEARQEGHRPYLGMSQIGDECSRKLWYYFRHCGSKQFDGRVLALFERGHNEEAQITKKLRMIGIKVVDRDSNGEQFEFVGYRGHFKGHMDAALHRVPEALATWHVGEYKTHSYKSFQDVAKDGVQKAKPVHFAQMQAYMGFSGMTRALYVAVNKNDDSIYTERVHFDNKLFDDLCAKAAYIIDAKVPPGRLSNDPLCNECKWCDYHAICFENKIPQANCRTCTRSMPVDDGKWSCDKQGQAEKACGDHLYISALLGTPVASGDDYFIYQCFVNATEAAAEGNAFEGLLVHTSKQLEAASHLSIAADANYLELREAFA